MSDKNTTVSAFAVDFDADTPVWVTKTAGQEVYARFVGYVDNPIPDSFTTKLCQVRRENGYLLTYPAVFVHRIQTRLRSSRGGAFCRPVTQLAITDLVRMETWPQVMHSVRSALGSCLQVRVAIAWQDRTKCHSVLHEACSHKAPTEVIEALMRLVPGAVWRRKRCGKRCMGLRYVKDATPLHVGLQKKRSARGRSLLQFTQIKELFLQRRLWTTHLVSRILQNWSLPIEIITEIRSFLPDEICDFKDGDGTSCLDLDPSLSSRLLS